MSTTRAAKVLAASLALGVCLATATTVSAEGAAAALDDSVDVPSKVLDNGLEVLVIEDHSLPLVTVEIVVRNGAYTEPPEYNGLSHLYEHMFFKGNAAIPTQERYLERQRELGLVWNGTTSDERVNYFFTLGSAQLEEGAQFMADAIMTPLFDEGELVKERQVVLGEVDRNESNPYFHLHRALQQKMFWKFPTRKDTLGDRKTIETATRDKMVTVQKKFYVPNNSALILAGDVTPEQGFALAEKYFGKWQKAEDPFVLSPVPKHPPIAKTEAVIVNQKVEGVTVFIGFHGPSVKTDARSTYAADVFSFIVGQKGSKFHKALVDSGLTLGTSLSYYTLTHTGPITLSFRTTPDKAEAAVQAAKAEIAKFNDPGYFTDEQIETAKTLLAVDSIFSREKTSSYAHTVSFWWAVAGLDYYKTYIDNLKKVGRDDMARYVETYMHGKPYVMAVLVSPETQKQIELDDKKAASWAQPIKAAKKGK